MLIRTCAVCHKEFIPLVGNQKKCINCKGKKPGQDIKVAHKVECIQCGVTFSTLIYNRKFCSKKCRELFHYNPAMIEKECVVCHKKFKTTKGNRKYCSELCAHKAKLNPTWRTLGE